MASQDKISGGIKIYPFGKGFVYGLITKLPPNQIPDGSASSSLNWLTIKGKLELSRGYQVLGTPVNSQSGTSGLRVGTMFNGTQVMFATYDQKVRYYLDSISDWTEVGSDMLPVAAKGEDISLEMLETVAGKQLWLNSPHTGPYKLNIANPGNAISMYDSSKNYHGWFRFFDNRAYLWYIDAVDQVNIRLSNIELRNLSDYSTQTDSGLTNNTAVSIAGSNAKASFFNITATAGGEAFTDDQNGNMIGASGGTGTFNYQTGVVNLIPASGPVATISTIKYSYIDETASWTTPGGAAEAGVANFLVPTPRVAGNPNVFAQGHGGPIRDIVNLNNNHYCIHDTAVYDIVQSQDDTTSTNTQYRETLGMKKMRGAYSAPEGVYMVDTTDPNNQRLVLVGYSSKTPDIKPTIISPNLDLSAFVFDKCVVFPFNDYVHFACRTFDSPANNRTFIYHRIYKTIDLLDYCINCADIFDQMMVAGDSLSPNIQQLYSGWDANGDTINNYWISGISRLGFITPRGTPRIIYGQKKAKKIYIEGYIMPDQILHMYGSPDRSSFVEILDKEGQPIISGDGDYVDRTNVITIGSEILGSHELGGQTPQNQVQAYHYARYLDLGLDRFEELQIKLQASGIGYLSVIRLEFRDLRILQNKPSSKYRSY